MPRFKDQNAEDFARHLEGAFIIVQADGGVDECDDDPVHVAVVYDESGFGPHTASLYVDQNRYHASGDSVLQEAYEMHEEWMRDHYGDHLKELEEERLAEHVKEYLDSNPGASNEEAIEAVQEKAWQEAEEWFTERMNGFTYTMSASEFVAVLANSTSKYVEEVQKGVHIVVREDCEEPEEEPFPRMSSTRRRATRGVSLPEIGALSGVSGAPHTWSHYQQAKVVSWLAAHVDLDNLRQLQDRVHEMQAGNFQRAQRSPGGLKNPEPEVEEEAIGLDVLDDALMLAVDKKAFGDGPAGRPVRRRRSTR